MKRLLFPLIGVLLLIVTVVQIQASRTEVAPRTAPVATARGVVAEGRVVAYPGAEVTVGSDVAGRIEQLAVVEQQRVRRGDVIALINADETRAALAEARARVNELDADIRLYQAELHRAQQMLIAEVGTRQSIDKSERDIDAARARRLSAIAEANRLEALLRKTRIEAPIDGVVIARHADRGETIVGGDPIVTIADLSRTRIEAEVDEYDIARIAIGGTTRISAEGFDQSWRGSVEEVPSTVVNRRLNPPDPSKPIDTRVLLVKVALSEPGPLKLGQRVELRFD